MAGVHGPTDPAAALAGSSIPSLLVEAAAPDFPLVLANSAFAALVESPLDDLPGRSLMSLLDPRREPATQEAFLAALRAGAAHSGWVRLRRSDGTGLAAEATLLPLRDGQGGAQRHLLLLQDLRPGPRGLRADIAIQRRGRFDYHVLSVGTEADRLHPAGVVGLLASGSRLLDHTAPAERVRVDRAIRLATERALPLAVVFEVGHGQGRTWIRLAASPRVEFGQTILHGTLQDVTATQGHTERLRLLEKVAVHADDGILITEAEPLHDPGPRIVYANDAIRRLTGYRVDELIGRSPRLFQGEDTDPVERARLNEAMREFRSHQACLVNYRKDGSLFWNEFNIVPVADETGWYTHWISIQRDVTQRRIAEQKVAFLAFRDELTGVGNRSLCRDWLGRAIAAARRDGGRVGVIAIDLDRFRALNDSQGHDVGDGLLREAARRLERLVRPADLVARLGGDEFAVVVTGVESREALAARGEMLLAALRAPFELGTRQFEVTASAGTALCPEDGEDPAILLTSADLALERAKRGGGDVLRRFDAAMRTEAVNAAVLEAELREALRKGELALRFQPQVDADDGRVRGVEALVRWRHPRRGLLAPAAFLPIAAQRGLAGPLDLAVLGMALATARRMLDQGLEFGRMKVNVSAALLRAPDFLDRVADALGAAGLSPDRLAIEIVEDVLLDHDGAGLADLLGRLRETGVAIELDDFGTGYASLTHLRRFPVDALKLDRGFVAPLGLEPENDAIVEAICCLARRLGKRVVAEGVESDAQARMLAGWGCDMLQGFRFAAPMEEDALVAWIQRAAQPGGGEGSVEAEGARSAATEPRAMPIAACR